jgi:hypothetical protein
MATVESDMLTPTFHTVLLNRLKTVVLSPIAALSWTWGGLGRSTATTSAKEAIHPEEGKREKGS